MILYLPGKEYEKVKRLLISVVIHNKIYGFKKDGYQTKSILLEDELYLQCFLIPEIIKNAYLKNLHQQLMNLPRLPINQIAQHNRT
ncbi:unnamed protein product [Paramecium sonneborni]|uniref:Uncharacterized protein n=1 Tax=Paramecium sonneborni TaxID=65129 RepID=A0A8S1RJX4_9CILI|nr:unnamed protein product [Paramecium sonneborni]